MIPLQIGGNSEKGNVISDVFSPKQRGGFFIDGEPSGVVAYTIPYREYSAAGIQLTDSNGSTDMAVDGSAGGTPDNVYIDEPTTNWTNSSLSGTWDFASTAVTPQGGTHCIDATATVNGSQAQMERTSSINMASYEAVSGYIYLSLFDSNRHSVQLEIRLAGVIVGNSVNIDDYIDTGLTGSFQKFVIPKGDLEVDGPFDQLVFTTTTTAGNAPNYYLDTINIEQTAGKLFSFTPPAGMVFEIFSVGWNIMDNITTLEPENFMGVSTLTNGVRLRTRVGGQTFFSVGFKSLFDIHAGGAELNPPMFGTTNTAVNFVGSAPGSLSRLKGDNSDSFSFQINDDLSTLVSFKAIVRGRILRS